MVVSVGGHRLSPSWELRRGAGWEGCLFGWSFGSAPPCCCLFICQSAESKYLQGTKLDVGEMRCTARSPVIWFRNLIPSVFYQYEDFTHF